MVWRNCDGASTKFRQLKSGLVKCLHVVCKSEKPMPAGRVNAHRNFHDERKRPRIETKSKAVREELKIAFPGVCMFYKCPNCNWYMGGLVVGTTPKCPSCGKHFKVGEIEPAPKRPPTGTLWRAQIRKFIDSSYAYCPYCGQQKAGRLVAEAQVTCDSCRRNFLLTK